MVVLGWFMGGCSGSCSVLVYGMFYSGKPASPRISKARRGAAGQRAGLGEEPIGARRAKCHKRREVGIGWVVRGRGFKYVRCRFCNFDPRDT